MDWKEDERFLDGLLLLVLGKKTRCAKSRMGVTPLPAKGKKMLSWDMTELPRIFWQSENALRGHSNFDAELPLSGSSSGRHFLPSDV